MHRHPHVFAVAPDHPEKEFASAADAAAVLRNWEKLKAREKGRRGLLAGVPRSMPALTRAQRIGEKVARVGFDWESAEGSRAKVTEELRELDAAVVAGDANAIEEEMGDVLFALVNLSRHLKIDAEGALRRASDKFTRRFAHVEKRVQEDHGGWAGEGKRDAAPSAPSRSEAEPHGSTCRSRSSTDTGTRPSAPNRRSGASARCRDRSPCPPRRSPEPPRSGPRRSVLPGAGRFMGDRSSAGCTRAACSTPRA